ncbi:MAG: redoxin domain-containing protein [Pseudomonadales bacterium]|nr:redoxin domain-containing protein [Pseudomonadales bacterium]
MSKHPFILAVILFGILMSAAPIAMAAPAVGEPAPEFELIGSDGKTWSLSDLKGDKWTVIAFFPKAFTGG